jgi:hypothetical protein
MKIKDYIKQDAGFQYVIDNMEFMSSAGRRKALNTEFSSDSEQLREEWRRLGKAVGATLEYKQKKPYIDLRHCLMQLHDLQGTLTSLANHTTLNEVELFEIKNLALLCRTSRGAIAELGLAEELPLPETTAVFDLLDPDHTGIANFYIYDSYDVRLAPLRRELAALQNAGGDPVRISELLTQQNEVQEEVCVRLSDQLSEWVDTLITAMEQMAYTDFLLAKADLSIRWNLTCPTLGEQTLYKGLVNPRLKERNEKMDLRYQPVDIELHKGVCIITGANMAGKTVLLKSVGTAQVMAQCGMFVPAGEAVVTLVDDVVTSIGDDQDEMNGLSSYASEIIKISNILQRCRKEKLLVLIDEPARTTNPVEGKALVQAIAAILEHEASVTLITTHYSGLGVQCRRLRVKGFVEGMADVPITPQNINLFIDYSLDEDENDNVPQEALRIADILGCDREMTSLARENINKQ